MFQHIEAVGDIGGSYTKWLKDVLDIGFLSFLICYYILRSVTILPVILNAEGVCFCNKNKS